MHRINDSDDGTELFRSELKATGLHWSVDSSGILPNCSHITVFLNKY